MGDTSFNNDIADNIEITKLIKAVKIRRPLYDTSSIKYRDRAHKKTLWDEVYEEICSPSRWNKLSKQDQLDYGCEVQKKWSSLRSCFRREFVAQNRQSTSRIFKKKKRKYCYFDALRFLEPFTEKAQSNLFNEEQNAENDKDIAEDPSDGEFEDNSETSIASPHSNHGVEVTYIVPTQEIKEEKVFFNKDSSLNSSGYFKTQAEISHNIGDESQVLNSDDGDVAFLQSLLPTMRELTSEQKLMLRIEIMKTLVKFKRDLVDNYNTSI